MTHLRLVFGLTLLLCIISTLHVSSVSVTVSTPVADESGLITSEYGLVNPQHIEYLPNHQDGHDIHYALSNLPIQNDDEKLHHIRFLFTPNPAVIGQIYSIIIHVARPTDGSTATASQRTVKYIDSYRVDGIVSGEKISLEDWNVDLKAGDIISLSVPNDAIFLRFGANHAGLNIPYGLLDVTPGSLDVDRMGVLYLASTDALQDGEYLQLCGAFVTYGAITASDAGFSFAAEFYFFTQNIPADGFLTTVTFVGLENAGAKIIVARPSAAAGGELRYVPSLSRDVASFPDGVEVTLSTPIDLKAGDWVGFISDSTLSLGTGSMTYYNIGHGYNPNYDTPEIATLAQFQENFYARMILKVTTESPTQAPTETPTEAPSQGEGSTKGDPQFSGFQGQSFQFHGLADEHFNLISSPQLQLNSHFVYLSSGNCDYNNTMCFQHPGTYVDVLGFTIPSSNHTIGDKHIKIVAGAHADGLRIWMDQHEMKLGENQEWEMDEMENVAIVHYNKRGQVTIHTPMFVIKVINSDFFFNLEFSLLDHEMLRVGNTHHTITDHQTCEQDKNGHAIVNTDDHGAVEAMLLKKYQVTYPLHGLIGQTWRNVVVCGKAWMGSIEDYLVSDIFGDDYYYNFYKSNKSEEL